MGTPVKIGNATENKKLVVNHNIKSQGRIEESTSFVYRKVGKNVKIKKIKRKKIVSIAMVSFIIQTKKVKETSIAFL